MLAARAWGVCSIVLLLVLSSLSIVPFSLGTPSYIPGVKIGDWWTYGSINVQCFYCPPEVRALQEITSIDSSVAEIIESAVTIQSLVTFTNGTRKTWSLMGNVETGQGNLTYQTAHFLIAGDLVKGNPIYNSPAAPTIDDTLATTAARLPQSLNLLAVNSPFYTLWQYWDQEKGVLAQADFSSPIGVQGSILLTDSIWHHASDFTVFLNATSVPLKPGEDRNLSVTVASRNGFEGSVGLSIPSQPAGLILDLEPPTVAVQPPGPANSILTIAALQQAPSGTHLVRVTASNQSVSHSTFLTIRVGGFTIAANPPHLSMATNANASTTITLTSVDNFAGEVQLTAVEITQNPYYGPTVNDPSGPRPFLNPTIVILAENGQATATLRVQTPNLPITGDFSIKITATSGPLSQSLNIAVTVNPVPDTSSDPSEQNTILGLPPFQFYSITAGALAVLATTGTLFVFKRRRKQSHFSA